MSNTILVTSSNREKDSGEYDHVIAVEDLLSEVTQDEFLETMSRVSSLEISETGCINYSLLWRRLSKIQTDTLVWGILFSQRLESRLYELDATHGTLVCGDTLEKPYRQVVEDLAEGTPLETRRQGRKYTVSTLVFAAQILFTIGKTAFVIGDWFVARLTALFTDAHDSTIIYMPAIERLNSSLPIVERFDSRPHTVVTEPCSYFHLQSDIKSALESCRPVAAHRYLSVSGFVGQIRDLGTICWEVLTLSSFTPDLVDAVESEFGIRLESTAGVMVRKALSNFHLVRSFLIRRSLRAVFSETEVEKAIISTLDPMGRAVIVEACNQDIQVYHIPHSIATTEPPNPKQEVTQFVSGELDIQYYKQVVPEELWWQWVPLGRPYLSSLYEQYAEQRTTPSTTEAGDDQFDVVVATVSAPQQIREQFIETMCESLNSDRFTVTIKPHPDEGTELYMQMAAEYENVRVITSGLYDSICDADLTITVNSNVGLESIVIGTPAVCFNSWRPFVVDQTYALFDEVPVFRSGAEFRLFATQLTGSELSKLRMRELEFVEQSYLLDTNTTADIAEYIQSDEV